MIMLWGTLQLWSSVGTLLLWSSVGTLLLLASAVNGAEDEIHFGTATECKYIILQGTHPVCQGLYHYFRIQHPSTLFYEKVEIQSGSSWITPKMFYYTRTRIFEDEPLAVCSDEEGYVVERDVPFECVGPNHLGVYDTRHDMSRYQCNYFTLTNAETPIQEMWGFYEEHASINGITFTQIVDGWGNEPPLWDKVQLQKNNPDEGQVINVIYYINDKKQKGTINIRRQICLGGKREVYTDVEEQPKSDYHYNCWVLQVTGGACGTGTWTRYIDGNWDVKTYRKWNPVRQEESDTHFQNNWSEHKHITLFYNVWRCEGNTPIDGSNVKCVGATAMWFPDRPWPAKYLDWVKQSFDYTSEKFKECKMFRFMADHRDFKKGYYLQTAILDQYFNEEAGVLLGIDGEKWAARTNCKWKGYNDETECTGGFSSHLPPNHERWACVSALTYCPYITVTSQETGAGICQGRHRLWRNKHSSRFVQEVYTEDQKIIDRRIGRRQNMATTVVSLIVTGADIHELHVECKTNNLFTLAFKIPRSRCFTHGTYYWNKVDYDPPPFLKESSCRYIEMEGQNKYCRGIWKVSDENGLQYRNEVGNGGQNFYWPEVGGNLAQVNSDKKLMTCFEGLDTNKVREQNVPYKCAGFSHITGGDQNVMDGKNDWHCQYVQVTNFETDDYVLWGFYWQQHWGDKKIFERKADQYGNKAGGRLQATSADQYGIRVTGYLENGQQGDSFFIHRKRCQGSTKQSGQITVYSDREEHNRADDVYSYKCWTLEITEGLCGGGKWTRIFYDDRPNQWWYRRFETKVLPESDLYHTLAWHRGDRVYFDTKTRAYLCEDKGEIPMENVKCSGATNFTFRDRPLPYKYILWLAETNKFTRDAFGECKMFRMLKKTVYLVQGYYVQTANADEYLDEEHDVVMGFDDGKVAAKDAKRGRCIWDQYGYASCRKWHDGYTSHMNPADGRFTCVSTASYCGYITVTANETPAGMCQGRWRLWRRNTYTRFDQEIKTGNNNQEIVDRKFGGELLQMKISVDENMNMKGVCLQDKIKFRVEFDIPRSRCFTHGTFHWDQVDYDPPFKH